MFVGAKGIRGGCGDDGFSAVPKMLVQLAGGRDGRMTERIGQVSVMWDKVRRRVGVLVYRKLKIDQER